MTPGTGAPPGADETGTDPTDTDRTGTPETSTYEFSANGTGADETDADTTDAAGAGAAWGGQRTDPDGTDAAEASTPGADADGVGADGAGAGAANADGTGAPSTGADGTEADEAGSAASRSRGQVAGSRTGGRLGGWVRERRAGLAVTAGFMAASFALFGRLWADPSRRYLVDGGQDQTQWEWFFAVTARAVTHLDDPFFTRLQNFPAGVNLMANTVMLGVSVPLTPVTLAFGPSVTWALVLTLGVGGSAAAWYRLLRRHLGASPAAAAAGGALCGFAPPIVSHANAHPNFVVLAVLPFMIGRLVRLARREGTPPRDGAVLGLLTAYQVYLGEEVLLLAATGLALFAAAYAVQRPAAARAAAGPLAAGLGVAAFVFLPLTAYALLWQFFGVQSYDGLVHGPSGNDLVRFTAFARQSLAGHQALSGPLAASTTEQNAFFGWPLVLLLAALVAWLRRDPLARALAVVVGAAAALSLGPEVTFDGDPTGVPGPWRLAGRLPLFESVIESRLTLVCVPAAGVLLALGVDRFRAASAGLPRGTARLLCGALLAQALVPIAPKPLAAHDRPPVPAFFTDGTWRRYVRPGRTLVPAPPPDVPDAAALHWQVEAGLGFPLPEGYFIGPFGPDRLGGYGAPRRPLSELLAKARDEEAPPPVTGTDRAAARADLAYWKADVVVLGPVVRRQALYDVLVKLLGPARFERGVWLWDVRNVNGGTGG